jgi:hypothetical protein
VTIFVVVIGMYLRRRKRKMVHLQTKKSWRVQVEQGGVKRTGVVEEMEEEDVEGTDMTEVVGKEEAEMAGQLVGLNRGANNGDGGGTSSKDGDTTGGTSSGRDEERHTQPGGNQDSETSDPREDSISHQLSDTVRIRCR